jgi:hypothetical protein
LDVYLLKKKERERREGEGEGGEREYVLKKTMYTIQKKKLHSTLVVSFP